MDIYGKAGLITGGNSGIGAATALELACRVGDVAITGLTLDERACRVKREVESCGRKCHLTATA